MAIRVLIVAFEKRWLAPVYMPSILTSHGAEVALFANVDSYAARLLSLARFYAAPDRTGTIDDIHLMLAAIRDWKPDLILPGDDMAYGVLHAVAMSTDSAIGVSSDLRELIVKSVGDSAGYPILISKANTLARARELGIAEPGNQVVRSVGEAQAYAAPHGGRAVIKVDGEAGGSGVVLCRSPAEIDATYLRFAEILRQRGHLGRIAISIQRLIEGPPVACMFAAHKGNVLAGMAFQKLHIYPEPTGPATMVAPFAHADIGEAARRICASTGFTGLGSLDFVIDNGTPILLECNPRMTQITHLPRYWGIDPCAALLCAFEDKPYHTEKVARPPERITLFPQEWWRDRNSPDLKSGVLDGPFDEPLVMRALAPDWR